MGLGSSIKKHVKKAVKKVTGAAKKAVGAVTGGSTSSVDNSGYIRQAQAQAQQAQMQAEESNRATQFLSGDNMAAREGGPVQAGLGTTMLTDSDGVTLTENSKKKKTLLGA